jgi:uncharacterized membrane protein
VRKWGVAVGSLLGPFPTKEHAETVAQWKNAEEGLPHPWYIREWNDFLPPGQERIRAAGLAPE